MIWVALIINIIALIGHVILTTDPLTVYIAILNASVVGGIITYLFMEKVSGEARGPL